MTRCTTKMAASSRRCITKKKWSSNDSDTDFQSPTCRPITGLREWQWRYAMDVTCQRCGTHFSESDAFCTKCGMRRDAAPRPGGPVHFCTKCGSPVGDAKFCTKCGASAEKSADQ